MVMEGAKVAQDCVHAAEVLKEIQIPKFSDQKSELFQNMNN